jgi:hypothetical protein
MIDIETVNVICIIMNRDAEVQVVLIELTYKKRFQWYISNIMPVIRNTIMKNIPQGSGIRSKKMPEPLIFVIK